MKIKLNKILSNPSLFLVTGFGIGFIPVASGTFGSILGVLIFLALAHFSLPIIWNIIVIVTLYVTSFFVVQASLKCFKEDDPSEIVIDEMLAMMLVMLTVPLSSQWVFLAFLLFRFFDIFKPWPIYLVDSKMKGTIGIMLDDVLAAFYSTIVIMTIRLFLII